MELVYIYLKSCSPFRGEQHIQLDLTRRYEYKNRKITFENIKAPSEKSFGGKSEKYLSNMTAIVGKNGTGKTQLLNIISNRLAIPINSLADEKYILLFKIDDWNFLTIDQNGNEWLWREESKGQVNRISVVGAEGKTKLATFLFYNSNESFGDSRYLRVGRSSKKCNLIDHYTFKNSDISISESILFLDEWLQYSHIKKDIFRERKYEVVLMYDRKSLLNFALNYEEFMEFSTVEERSSTSDLGLNYYNENKPIYFKSLKAIEKWGEYDIFHAFVANQFQNIAMDLRRVRQPEVVQKHIENCLTSLSNQEITNLETLLDFIMECRETLLDNKLIRGTQTIREITESVEERLGDWCTRDFSNHIQYSSDVGKIIFTLEKENPLTIEEKKLIQNSLDETEVQAYEPLVKHWFQWSIEKLSEGEKSYIQLFSALSEVINYAVSDGISSVLLLLDEPDQNLHPELSRQLIDLFNQFIKARLDIENQDLRIQLIVTTHSPFVVTDFSSDHVLYLERDEEGTVIRPPAQQTFAANIHHLLMDDFFMEQTIGEFARKQLNDIMQRMQVIGERRNKNEDAAPLYEESYSQEEKDYIWAVIQAVGDPFVRHALHKKFESTFYSKDQQIDREIQELRERIERLQRKREERR